MKLFNTTSVIVVLFSFLAVGCTTNKLEITTDYKKVDFTQLKTYQWRDIKKGPVNFKKEVYTRITQEINQNLVTKGYFTAIDVKPDFYIRYGVTALNEIDVKKYNAYEDYSNEFSWKRGYGLQATPNSAAVTHAEVDVKRVRKGTLVIDIIDPLSNKIVWRGIAKKQLNNTVNLKQRDQAIREAVTLILENFPPK